MHFPPQEQDAGLYHISSTTKCTNWTEWETAPGGRPHKGEKTLHAGKKLTLRKVLREMYSKEILIATLSQ